MGNGWTGGQYSLFRALVGAYLFAHFGILALGAAAQVVGGFGAPPGHATALLTGAGAGVFLAIGLFDRAAAGLAAVVWFGIHGWNPMGPGAFPVIGWLLAAHVFTPPAPYGSWAARGRPDPGVSWRRPVWLHRLAWGALAAQSAAAGILNLLPLLEGRSAQFGATALAALELAFALAALRRRWRRWSWLPGTALQAVAAAFAPAFEAAGLGTLWLALYAFDPAWIRPLAASATETLFYDGHCGLCHRAVRFVLAEDSSREAFRFAPLEGETFLNAIPAKERSGLPDSLVVRTDRGALLVRSAGALHVLRRLGGLWRVAAALASFVPSGVLDGAYDAVARVRHHLFKAPAEACPIVPKDLRGRFEA